MGLFGRGGRTPPPDAPPAEEQQVPEPSERSAQALGALFEGLRDDGSHTVLDLGSASVGSFDTLGRFARRVRFAGLLAEGVPTDRDVAAVPTYEGHPYDVILAWHLLDLVAPRERPALVRALTRISTPRARLYLVSDTARGAHTPRLGYELRGTDRVVERVVGPPGPRWPEMLPADLERLLEPFRVVRAVVLKGGRREYLAVRSPAPEASPNGQAAPPEPAR